MLAGIKSKPKQMYLGNHSVLQEASELEISDKLLASEQCKHWMEYEVLEQPEVVEAPVVEAPVVEEIDEALADDDLVIEDEIVED